LDRRDLIWINVTTDPTAEWIGERTEVALDYANRKAGSKPSCNSTEQGIISAEQGILAQEQGISLGKTEIIAG
jgi:hypothetical protein